MRGSAIAGNILSVHKERKLIKANGAVTRKYSNR